MTDIEITDEARKLLADEFSGRGAEWTAERIRRGEGDHYKDSLRAIQRALHRSEDVPGEAVEAALKAYKEYAKEIGEHLPTNDRPRREALSRALTAAFRMMATTPPSVAQARTEATLGTEGAGQAHEAPAPDPLHHWIKLVTMALRRRDMPLETWAEIEMARLKIMGDKP